jgi:outer membrane receptor protein involved in Fe transport
MDAFASYDFSRATLAVNINNLSDEQYFVSGGTARIVPGAPRTVRTTVQMRF